MNSTHPAPTKNKKKKTPNIVVSSQTSRPNKGEKGGEQKNHHVENDGAEEA